MAIAAGDLKKWLNDVDDNQGVAVDDGGLALVVVDDQSICIEVGGLPDDDDTDEWIGISGCCPVCGETVTITGRTPDMLLIGSCRDTFSEPQWEGEIP